MSQRIRALEEQLGVALFNRTTRSLRLTRDGEVYYEEIEGPLQRIHGATRRVQSRARARHRELAIAAHFGFAHRWLLPRFARHEAVFPVCSAACRERLGLGEVLDADSLARVPLLHMDEFDSRWLSWHQWYARAGFEAPARGTRFHYNNYPLLLNAAAEGSGLALGWAGLCESMIEEDTLVRMGPVVERDDRGYILSARHPDSATVAAVIDWFHRQSVPD